MYFSAQSKQKRWGVSGFPQYVVSSNLYSLKQHPLTFAQGQEAIPFHLIACRLRVMLQTVIQIDEIVVKLLIVALTNDILNRGSGHSDVIVGHTDLGILY